MIFQPMDGPLYSICRVSDQITRKPMYPTSAISTNTTPTSPIHCNSPFLSPKLPFPASCIKTPLPQPRRVSPYSATGSRPSYQEKDGEEQGRSNTRPLVGRDTEMAMVLNKAANMISGLDTGGVIVIEGNTGTWQWRQCSAAAVLCTFIHHARERGTLVCLWS